MSPRQALVRTTAAMFGTAMVHRRLRRRPWVTIIFTVFQDLSIRMCSVHWRISLWLLMVSVHPPWQLPSIRFNNIWVKCWNSMRKTIRCSSPQHLVHRQHRSKLPERESIKNTFLASLRFVIRCLSVFRLLYFLFSLWTKHKIHEFEQKEKCNEPF